jgi:hypothetical protein
MLSVYNEVGNKPILVALSALINEDVRKKCLKAGFNVIMESPLTVKKIEEEILKQAR